MSYAETHIFPFFPKRLIRCCNYWTVTYKRHYVAKRARALKSSTIERLGKKQRITDQQSFWYRCASEYVFEYDRSSALPALPGAFTPHQSSIQQRVMGHERYSSKSGVNSAIPQPSLFYLKHIPRPDKPKDRPTEKDGPGDLFPERISWR